jgi:hypothetical protein
MRPSQNTNNAFELAILKYIALDEPALLPFIPKLIVKSRKLTGYGSFTEYTCKDSDPELGNRAIGHPDIIMPNVPNGLGAVLFCTNGKPDTLETYTYGDEKWDGDFDGFSIRDPS